MQIKAIKAESAIAAIPMLPKAMKRFFSACLACELLLVGIGGVWLWNGSWFSVKIIVKLPINLFELEESITPTKKVLHDFSIEFSFTYFEFCTNHF